MITLTSYDGTAFSSIDWTPVIPQDAREEWDVQARITPRPGMTSLLAPGAISPRRVTVDFVYEGALDVREAVDQLVGLLDPRDPTARALVGTRVGGETVRRYARVELPGGADANDALNGLRVVFVGEDPEWVETTDTAASQSGSSSPFSLSHTNQGQATVHPRCRIGWSAQHSANGTVVGQRYRKRMTLTNTQDRTLGPFPYAIALGDTAALVSGGKAQADGDDLRVIIDGVDMPRYLIGWNLPYGSLAWVVIPGMDAGEVLTIDVVYGNASAANPPGWTDPDPDKPIIDLYSESGAATGGSTTTVVKASATWDSNRFYRGDVTMLTGANAGLSRTIDTNSPTTLTLLTAFPSAVANTDQFLITMSDNARWVYAVRNTDRKTEYWRGRYYINASDHTPSVVSYEAPGSWRPELVWDNRDSFGIRRYARIDVGGGDLDSFASLDARRMWEGNDKRVYNAGAADGLSLTTPVPIMSLSWEFTFDNPNGMTKLSVLVRASGAEDWAEAYSYAAATSGVYNATEFVSIQSAFGDVWQVVTAIGPADDVEIDLDWRRDTGSATSGTTTTTTDSTKEWATDQFDNGKIRMLSGANAGRVRSVTSNTSTAITHAAFPAANADGDRYVVTNKRLRAELKDDDVLVVNLDNSVLTDSGLGSETAVYDAAMSLWIGPGPAGAAAGQHRALIGYATTGTVAAGIERRVFLAADEVVEIDAAARRVRIYDTVAEEYIAELTDPAVIVQYHDGTAWRRSANWLPLGIGAQQAWLQETNIGTLELDISYAAAWLGG